MEYLNVLHYQGHEPSAVQQPSQFPLSGPLQEFIPVQDPVPLPEPLPLHDSAPVHEPEPVPEFNPVHAPAPVHEPGPGELAFVSYIE